MVLEKIYSEPFVSFNDAILMHQVICTYTVTIIYACVMREVEKRKRIEHLARLIIHHQDLYYSGSAKITDETFDALWDELTVLTPQHPVLHGIGRDEDSQYAKKQHRLFMHSQNKVNDAESFTAWAEKLTFDIYLIQHKLDGVSFELQYDKGLLVSGVSRGNGLVGDDLTHNAVRIPGIPFVIDETFTGGVRGEVIMDRDVHTTEFPDLANTRNTTSGLMKRKDGIGVQFLKLIVYDARSTEIESYFENERKKIDWLVEQSFNVVETIEKKSVQDVLAYRESVIERRASIPYDIDGLVIKGIDIDEEDSARPRPEKQVAFKFDNQQASTILESIAWNRNGHRISPIACFVPVHLHGTVVKRASLVNLQSIQDLNLSIGSRIIVSKRGEIIPKIEMALDIPEGAYLSLPPLRCDVCKDILHRGLTDISCVNPHCRLRAMHRTQKWISMLSLEGFGKKRVEQLFELGLISDIPDLYRLTKTQLVGIDRFGEKLADNLLQELQNKSSLSLAACMAGFDMAGIGVLTARAITQAGYTTIESLEDVTIEALCAIHGIGTTLAESLVRELRVHVGTIRGMIQKKMIVMLEEEQDVETPLTGKSFCFTGSLSNITRKKASELVTQRGGSVATSVGGSLDYIVVESLESQSQKAQKARSLGITFLTEQMFLDLINQTA